MKKLKCVIVDDETLALDVIERYIAQTPFLELEARFDAPITALAWLAEHDADLLFIDIQMPDLTGLELSKSIKKGSKIIFTTAFEKYALEGFKADALDYLLKPFNYEEFYKAASKAKEWYERTETSSSNPENDYIFVKADYKHIKIFLKDIFYFEGLKDYVKIHIFGQTRPVISLMSLKHLEEQLPANMFMRVHRSYIINLDRIESVERGQAVINKFPITIADNYKEKFSAYLNARSINL